RSCRFPQWLGLSPAANFELLSPEDAAAFKPESYEFVPFAKFPSRLPPCAYLTDFIGKVIALGKPNHVPRGSGVAPVQTVVVIDASGLEVEVSLWSELSIVLDADTVSLDDVSNPTIVAFLGFQIRPYMGKTTASSGFASRVLPNPCHPAADALRLHFTGHEHPIRYIVPKFDTPEKLKKHMQDSHRTIRELNDMYVAAGDPVRAVFYSFCLTCLCSFTSFVRPLLMTVVRYRLKFNVSDSTATTTFVLLGYTADRIMPISASELALAYPADYGPLPPTLQLMVGQKLIFGVHLPRQRLNNPYDDFRISKIWGLNMPRAQILAQLPPPPVPYRTPSPPSRHETPLPPDPAYVPPVPTYNTAPVPQPLKTVDPSPLPRCSFLLPHSSFLCLPWNANICQPHSYFSLL
ncbi:hypothetical protein LINGRAHAP2_LOCUS21070, partial [Linum grandiflorum]